MKNEQQRDTSESTSNEQSGPHFSADAAYQLVNSYADYFDSLNTPDDTEGAEDLRSMVLEAQKEGQEGLDGLKKLIAYFEETTTSVMNMPDFGGDEEWNAEKMQMLEEKIVAKLALEQERERRLQELGSTEQGPESMDKEQALKLEQSELYDKEASQVEQMARLARELQRPEITNDPDVVENILLEEMATLAGCDTSEVEDAVAQTSVISEQAEALGITPEKQHLFETLRIAAKNLNTIGPEATQRYLEERMGDRYGIKKVDLSNITDMRELRQKNVDIIETTTTDNPNLHGTIRRIYSEGYEMPNYQLRRADGSVYGETAKGVGVHSRVNVYKYEQ